MPEGEERRALIPRERRGLDPAILTFIHTLLEDHAEAHRREHELTAVAMNAALVKADEKMDDLGERLREYYDTILAERDSRYNERHNASQEALKEAAASAQEAVRTALRTAREETNKTEANWTKTADATFVKIEQLQAAFSKAVPREESDRTQKENERRFIELAQLFADKLDAQGRALEGRLGALQAQLATIEAVTR